MFKTRKNRFCVRFHGYGYVPVATVEDDKPVFLTPPPKRIGDDAIIKAEGKLRKVRLLESTGHIKNGTYLVDLGAAFL